MALNLLEKTELWVNEITLENANLTDMARAVAGVLGLPEKEVLVVDVRPRHITFDVLSKEVPRRTSWARRGPSWRRWGGSPAST